ncbi:general secretion pathway protein GspH [Comamonas phosphati]|nr:general secretion pathway protein GspH [Comamonas phosphati]
MMCRNRMFDCQRTNGQQHVQRGFSLIELMTVVAIVAVLAVVAGPSFTKMVAQQRLRDATSALTESLWLARSEAVTRGTSIGFTFTSIGTGWPVKVSATNATIQTQDPIPAISSAAGTYTFNSFGRLTGAGNLELTHSGTGLKRCLSVTTAGRVNTKDGAC